MAYFTLHAYDADVWIREFRGLNQADISLNPDTRFAAEVENVETVHGVLQPQAAFDVLPGPLGSSSLRVETLASFHRRWYSGQGSHNWYICASGGKIYQKQEDSDVDWAAIPLPEGISSFSKNVWSWVTYEINPDNSDYPVDVLLVSNDTDGMYMIVPPDRPFIWGDLTANHITWGSLAEGTWEDVASERWQIQSVDTRSDPDDDEEPQKKFGVIERYAERIWGGALLDDPDMLVYSRPYKPTDWTAPGQDEQPEDGAGDVLQPTWDGDRFYALKRCGDQLLAFKNNKIWRVLGVSPSEYTFHEQYGRGTKYFNTIAVDGERVYMATEDGVAVYDGMKTTPYAKDQIEQIWRTVNRDALDQMCAAMYENRYYLAFPTGSSTVNNAMLVFYLDEGSILFYPDMNIESFLPTDDLLYATSSSLPGKILHVQYDSWVTGKTSGKPTKWVTPWMDFGYKRIQKGGFEVYFTPEVKGAPMTFQFSIQTEKKTKSKFVTVQTTTFKAKQRRIRFGGAGRRFRLIIETMNAPQNVTWRLLGGIQMVVETDPD
jgi:hypothetical protein